jgi:hypothetical protein
MPAAAPAPAPLAPSQTIASPPMNSAFNLSAPQHPLPLSQHLLQPQPPIIRSSPEWMHGVVTMYGPPQHPVSPLLQQLLPRTLKRRAQVGVRRRHT